MTLPGIFQGAFMWRCDSLKQLKSGGAPASLRAVLAVKPAREDAGAPFSEEIVEA
jgi:hypothetical protein